MKYSKHIIICTFVAVFVMIACKTKKETKTTTTPTPVVVETPKASEGIVTYETLKPLLAKSCNTSGCHDESRRRMNFKIYENLKYYGTKGDIDIHVLQIKNMPPDEVLTAEELALFKSWLKDGMTEK